MNNRVAEAGFKDTPEADARVATTGILLAGGRGRRLGGADKGLQPFLGKPMATFPLAALQTVAATTLISANRNPDAYAAFGCRVIADENRDFAGPLAGLLAGLTAANQQYVSVLPCDTPLAQPNLLLRLQAALHARPAGIAVAHDGQRLQPLFLALKGEFAAALGDYLASGDRKVEPWLTQMGAIEVDCSDLAEQFANANTPDEWADLEARARAA